MPVLLQRPQCEAAAAAGATKQGSAPPLSVTMAHRLRRSLEPPHQSRFRVVCVIEYEDDGGATHVVTGTNAEPGYIGGSICAERAALCKLREAPFVARVASVTVVTDADAPLCPSVLCREFLATHLDPDVTVIMSGASVLCREFLATLTSPSSCLDRGMKTADEDSVETCRIGDLYPFPCIYGVTDREALLRHGFEFARRADAPETAIKTLGLSAAVAESAIKALGMSAAVAETAIRALGLSAAVAEVLLLLLLLSLAYELAQRETARDAKDALHPLRYAAVVVYEDGTSAAAHQLKAAEYGSTLDPVSQLLRGMLDRKLDDGVRATHIVDQFGNCHAPFAPARYICITSIHHRLPPAPCVDQFGNCHAPFAPARALLTEHGFADVDQFGNCHAPFAPARALLTEHGFGDVTALSHDAAGRLHAVAAAALIPRIGGELSDADIDARVAPPSSRCTMPAAVLAAVLRGSPFAQWRAASGARRGAHLNRLSSAADAERKLSSRSC
ncbi:hypothetical protein JKP88DRAFT_288551 [Tribonema minus]|uniref:CMP/dCMP-type deaminase domain-containing protein n=1 Tax=Tribonema minus TaxID=303371 RepID=A0A835ZD32_9STRA|nr:hypothetical protein JKP88DRAFT_288551 [Tribonema minus]